VLAATSTDLQRACASGRFLRELHQRLHLVLRMPTLAERTDDVPVLLDALGRAAAIEHGLPWPGVDEGACRYACAARWPRNVDDLKAAVERGLLASEGLRPLRADDLVLPVAEPSPMPSFVVGADGRVERWKDAVLAFKRGYATYALERHAWNIAGTAKALGVSRSRMFALLHELELRPRSGEGTLSIDDDAEG
jgi:DNA-binding NtrC family response regulator